MTRQRLCSLFFIIGVMTLVGCGQKGPLKRPDQANLAIALQLAIR